jgi:ATP-binding cassette, subfamily B, bacterial MsbA
VAPASLSSPALAVLRPHRWRLAAGVGCLLILAASGALYAYLCGPLLQLILSGGAQGSSYFLALLPGVEAARFGVPLVAALLVSLALIKGLAHLGQVLLLDGTAARVGCALRVALYGHLLRLPLAEHRRHARGDLLARLIDDVRQVQEVVVSAPVALARELLAALGLLAVAVAMAPQLTAAAAIALPIAALVIGLLARAVKRTAAQGQGQLGRLAARAAQGIGALREVKSCGAEERERAALAEQGERTLTWTLRQLRLGALAPLCNEVAAAAALGGTLIWASGRVAAGTLAAERFISFFAAVLLMYKPVKEIGRAVHQLAAGQASVERVDQLLRQEAEDAGPMSHSGAPSTLPPLRRQLELRRVAFSYGEARWTLEEIDLVLPVGRIVALAGPSGAGKTTLASLACGLERPHHGSVIWDGQDLARWPLSALRAATALVPQQPLLFDATVFENIRYGAPDASDAAITDAARSAHLDRPLAKLERGLQTLIGPGGSNLSAGEAQRLALARALVRQTSLLVLDEPSSALDPASEAVVVETLRSARQGRAVLVVAHSPAILAVADEIVRLEEGRVVPSAVDALATPPPCPPPADAATHR